MTYPRRTALRLKRRFNGASIEQVADSLNIGYYEFCLAPRIRGFAGTIDGQAYIVTNQSLSLYWRKTVAFHELGHILLHDTPGHFFIEEHTLFYVGKFERQANEFAAEYLIPDDAIRSGADKRLLAEELQVPVELFDYKTGFKKQ